MQVHADLRKGFSRLKEGKRRSRRRTASSVFPFRYAPFFLVHCPSVDGWQARSRRRRRLGRQRLAPSDDQTSRWRTPIELIQVNWSVNGADHRPIGSLVSLLNETLRF
jgi:hypothetical protein